MLQNAMKQAEVCVSQHKKAMEKAIIAMREKKMGTEIILLYFYLSYSFVHKFISY
jgi:hypothetical protein